jgi:hypothetical protein
MRRLALSGVAAALLSGAFEPSSYRAYRAVQVAAPGGVCAVKIDRAVYDWTRPDLADLRLVRDGEEIPYVLETIHEKVLEQEVSPEVLDRIVAAGDLRLTLRLPEPVRHNRLRIATSAKNFRTSVLIETSDDGRRWAVARKGASVFDFSEGDRRVSVLEVDYPVSTRRYVRATFHERADLDFVRQSWLKWRQDRPARREEIAVLTPVRIEDAETKSTLLTLDLGRAGLPHDRAAIESETAAFHRVCEVETSADGKVWTFVARGMISRLPPEESPEIAFPERHNRYLRLRIFNRDDQPLRVRGIRLSTLERRVRFVPPAAGEYRLYFGFEKAKQPSYDLAELLSRRAPEEEAVLAAGAVVFNALFRPPPAPVKPWTERHPALLYAVLAASIGLMAYLAVRLLGRAGGAGR